MTYFRWSMAARAKRSQRARERWVVVLAAACVSACRAEPETASPEPATPAPQPTESASDVRLDPSAVSTIPQDVVLQDPSTPRERPAPVAVQTTEAAMEALRTGNAEGARDFLASHVKDHPDDATARMALARAHRLLGERARALEVLAASDSEEALQLRGLVLLEQGRFAEAEALLTGALARHPKSLPLQGDLLGVLVARGRGGQPRARALMDGLYDAYDRGGASSPADLLAVAQAALARGSKGAFKDANMVLEDAEAKAPVGEGSLAGDRILLVRARMFAEKYAAQEAMTTYELLLQRNPWHPDALAGSARVQSDNLQFAMASRSALEALQVDPHHPEAHAVLAKVALIEGRRDEARERVRDEVLAVDPSHTAGLSVLAALALMDDARLEYERWRDEALAVNPHNGAFYKELSEVLGFLHLYPEAREILDDGVARAPDDPYVRAARGLNLLRLGREAEARADLELAWKRDPFNERTRNVLDLYEGALANEYGEGTFGDLTLRLPLRDRDVVEPMLAEAVGRSRAELDQAYGMAAGALRLEFFERPEEFSIRTVGVPSLGAVAVCFGPVITFIGPYHGTHNIENVIRHELAHVYAIQKSRGRVPRWFTEGLSEWESELADPAWARESAALLERAREQAKLRHLQDLELAFIRAESPAMMEVAYSTAAYAIRYLGETYGREKLVAVLEGYGRGKTTEVLFREHFGQDLEAVDAAFQAWLGAQLEQKLGGWRPATERTRADKRDALFARAKEQIRSEDRAGALATLQELVRNGGDGYAPRLLLGKLTSEGALKNEERAKAHLRAAVQHHPESIEPLVLLADLARASDDPKEEKARLQQALAIDGESFEPAARLLMLAELTDDQRVGRVALRRARAIAPLHPLALAGHALARARVGAQGEAKRLVERAVSVLGEPRGPADTLVVMALAAHAAGEGERAATLATQALELGELPSIAAQRLRALAAAG